MEECCCQKKKSTPRDEESKKAIVSRINKIVGQMNGVKKMIEEDRYCDDVLIQLSAIDKSIKSLANIILDDHMHSCLIENIKNGNYEAVDEILDGFLKELSEDYGFHIYRPMIITEKESGCEVFTEFPYDEYDIDGVDEPEDEEDETETETGE